MDKKWFMNEICSLRKRLAKLDVQREGREQEFGEMVDILKENLYQDEPEEFLPMVVGDIVWILESGKLITVELRRKILRRFERNNFSLLKFLRQGL